MGGNDRHVRCGGLVVAALMALTHPASAQQIYKWVDEKGTTQYTTTPPPGGKAHKIQPPPAGVTPAPASKSWKEQEIEFRSRQVERAEVQRKQELENRRSKYNAALRREACIDAHRNLQSLQQQRPVYSLNEKGERQYLDDVQRAESIRKSKAFIEQECQK